MVSRRLTRREMLRAMALTAGAAAISACAVPAAPAAPEGAEAGAQAAPAGAVTVQYWTPGEDLGAAKVVIQKFTEAKGIKVEHTFVPLTAGTQASEKLMAAVAGGEPPDVAYFDRFLIASWAARDALTDITDLAQRDNVKAEDFLSYTWKEAVYCDKVYGLPTTTDARALYYNRAHFAKAGLDPDVAPKTWSEIDAMHEKLTKGDAKDGYSQIGMIPWYPWLEWMLYVWDFEKHKCIVNTDPWLQTADWMTKYAKSYDIAAVDAFGSQFGPDAQDPFGNGLISMMQHGSWMLRTYKQYFPDLDYEVAPMPGPASATGRNLAGGWSVVLPKGVKHMEEGWQFANYYTSPEAQYILFRDASEGLASLEIPTRVAVANDPTIAFAQHPKAKNFIASLDAAYTRPAIPEGQLLFEELGKASDLIVHLKVDPKEALDGVAAKVDTAMAQWTCK
jgi:multiple sugar transport system substrate-binding protein